MILIATRSDDDHTDTVVDHFQKRGIDYIRFDTASFLQDAQISLGYGRGDRDRKHITINGRDFQLEEIRAVWYRRPLPPWVNNDLSAADQEFVRDEATAVLEGWWHLLHDRFWVNPYLPDKAAHNKAYQLQVARDVGLDVPRTAITSNPDEALEFFEDCNGQVIFKTLSNHVRAEGATGWGIYTSRVEREDLVSRLAQVELAPCFFQEYVRKQVELRITVMGNRLFTAEIESQSLELSSVDWRRSCGRGLERIVHSFDCLPPETEKRIQKLMRRLGLVFGCLDFVLTPDGRFVFLEINPNGQWLWIEEITGQPLLEAFADLMIRGVSSLNEMAQTGTCS